MAMGTAQAGLVAATKLTFTHRPFPETLPLGVITLDTHHQHFGGHTSNHISASPSSKFLGIVGRLVGEASFTFHMGSVRRTRAGEIHGHGKSMIGGHDFPTLGNELILGIPKIHLATTNDSKHGLVFFLQSLDDR